MSKKIQHNPILILPQKDVPFASSNHGEAGSGAQTAEGFMAGGFSRGAAFLAEPFKLSHAEWAWLAINHPTLFQNYMRFPYDPTVLCELAKVALGNGIRDLSQDGSFVDSAVSDHYIDLTPMSSRSLGVFFGRAGGVQPSLVRVVFDQVSGEYRVEWRNTGFVSKRDVDGIFSSGFKHGSPVARLTNHVALGKVITDVGVSDNVMKGAMVMLIPNEALFEPPDIIAMSENRLGVPQYYRIEGPAAPKGSSVELVISPVEGRPVGERFRVGDLIDLLFQDAVSAWEKGRTPALALDLDGTLFDARGYTVLLFREWLAQYDGPDAKSVRDLVVKAGNVGGWNGREILKGLGVTRQETLESAYAYHERYFFDPIRRASSLPIKGPIKLVKMLDRMLSEKGIPLKHIFITLRNAKDDSLPDGTSSSEVSLRKNGIFDENSLILRYDGVIDWSEEAYKNPKHEPEKWEMAAKFRKKNPDVWFVGAFDNATAHINGYRNIFGHNIVSVHIKGDLPPNSPSLVDGVYTIDPWQLGREISELGGVSHPDLSRPPQPLSGPAFAPMLDAIRAAWGSGKRPVVAVDIDDTLFASSKRAKRILSDFLSEWMPGSSWVADFVSKYIPSQVEYGPNHILSQAGLGHLGFGNTFNDYFSRRFMGPEEAHRISVRQGALNVLLALQSLGVRIIYMSGRSDNPYVRNDTAYQLKALGFPVDDFGVELVMRQDLQKSDEDFKGDALAGLVGPFDSLVGVFDNEPGVLSNINRRFSMAPLYLVGDRQSAGTKPPPEGTLPVANFLGKTGRMPLPGNVQMGESMRLEGFSLSREFAAKMDEYRQLEASFKDGDASRSARMSKLLSSSASILKRISSLDAAHPMHAAFVLYLNGLFDGVPESIERHTEGFIDEINRGRKDPFVLLRTQEGIMQIAATRQGKIDVRLYKSHAPFITPSPLPILKDAAGINLISALSVIPSGPVLPGKSGEFHYNAMMFGALTDTFPRMGFAFSWVVGSILSWKGGDAGDLFALEYSPGISLGNMIAMARMGVRVGWHEPDLARRLQTEHAISHLPMDLQAKIRYSGNDRKNRRADIVVLNSPHAKGFEQVAKKHFGGVVVSQSGSSAAKLMGKIPEDGNWALIGETELGEGEYVLPPNCMPNKPSSAHVPSGYFQVWRSVR